MKPRLASLLVIAALTAGAAATAQDAGLAALAGAWTTTQAERDGGPAADLIGHRLTIEGDRFAIDGADGRSISAGAIAVDPAASPPAIDFTLTEGADAGAAWSGVYALEGDVLRITDNAPDPNRPRPATLDAPAGSGYVAVTFQRAAP